MAVKVSMKVNGKPVSAEVEERTLLVTLIRENLRLTGTHVGCDTAQCGACTVHMNGKAIKSCSIVAMQAEGADILTIEGVAKADGTLHPMQAAFKENHGLAWCFCPPGMVMNALEFAKGHPNPTEQEVRESLEGNLCRCTGYHNIVKSIVAGAKAMAGGHRRGPVHRGRHAAAPDARRVRALAACARENQVDPERRRAEGAGRARRVHGRGPRRGQGRRPALRLADQRRQRPARG